MGEGKTKEKKHEKTTVRFCDGKPAACRVRRRRACNRRARRDRREGRDPRMGTSSARLQRSQPEDVQ